MSGVSGADAPGVADAHSGTKYRTIVADPPWPIKWPKGGTRTAGKTAATADAPCMSKDYAIKPMPYSTMSVDDIAALPVADIAATDSLLFMWTLDRYVMDGSAVKVARAWGFEPRPHMIVWHKPSAGLGQQLRPCHELILIGQRGSATLNNVSLRTVAEWKQPYENGAKVHSAKPDAALDWFEMLGDPPYMEMFARRARFGWDYWGNESLGTASMEVMPALASFREVDQ